MSIGQGYKSYLIMGNQSSWEEPCILSEMNTIIYEFVSCGLRNVSELIFPERFKGQPSPVAGIESFVNVEGELELHLHADNMLKWWMEVLQTTSENKTSSADKTLFPAGAWSSPFSLTTQPTATVPPCDPAKLTFTFSENKTGNITIVGKDQNDLDITETLIFSNNSAKTTTKFFKTVNAGGITTNINRVGNETLTVTGNKKVNVYILSLGDNVTEGMTLEVSKGGIPSVYTGVVVNTATISLEDVMRFTLGLLGKRGYNSCKLSTSGSNRIPIPSSTPSSLTGFTRVTDQVFPSWGMYLQLDWGSGFETIPIASMTLTLDNNLRFVDRYKNDRYRSKPVRGGNRNFSLTVGIDYNTSYNIFDYYFLNTLELSAKLKCFRKPGAGAEYSIEINIPRCQITTFPDPAVTDYAEIVQELTLRPLRTLGATTSDELSVILQCLE